MIPYRVTFKLEDHESVDVEYIVEELEHLLEDWCEKLNTLNIKIRFNPESLTVIDMPLVK